MNTHAVPPLQLMCLRKAVIVLFNRTDMKKCLHRLGYHFLNPHVRLHCIVKRGKELAANLPIPDSVKSALIDVLRSMAIEVFNWYRKYGHFIPDDFDVLSSFHWRSDGAIDELKTVQTWVQKQDADIGSRFKKTCDSLLTSIQKLKKESPNDCEELFKLLRQATRMSLLASRKDYNSSSNSNFEQTLGAIAVFVTMGQKRSDAKLL
ncbi:hypothetical protein CDAR_567971 [Caerostris darwini]|uniref:Uncharacterized protein n=1 Tax=Caerostris darwini TaxID=1538125 RepID=A0AAV4R4F8_9ARAC|nr:hypothetical protein CDAR_567971 [Caerostris darwini]